MRSRSWLDVLPLPYSINPVVVLFLVPDHNVWRVAQTVDGRITFGFSEDSRGNRLCIQVLHPDTGTWLRSANLVRKHGFRMATPDYLGHLHDIPHELLIKDEHCPMAILHDAPTIPMLNLKTYFMKKDTKWS